MNHAPTATDFMTLLASPPTKMYWSQKYNETCYTRSPLVDLGAPWHKWFPLGGPGGKDPGCTGLPKAP